MDSTEMKQAIQSRRKKRLGKSGATSLLFSLISALADNSIVRTGMYVVLLIVEALHFLYLPLQYASRSESSFAVFSAVTSFVNYFRFALDLESDLGILIVQSGHILFVLLLVTSIVVLVCHGGKNRVINSKFLTFLAGFLSSSLLFITTALIIPMLESFIYPLLCFTNSNLTPANSLLACGSPLQISLAAFGIVCLLCTLVLFYTATNMLVDDYWLSTLPWAGECREVLFLHGIAKLLLGVYLGADLNGLYSTYALLVLLFLQLTILGKRIDVTRSYNKVVHITKLLQEGVILSVYLFMLFERVYIHIHSFFLQCIVMMGGVCMGVLAYIWAEEKRKRLLQRNWHDIKLLPEAESYVQAACALCFGGQNTSEWQLMLSYVLLLHRAECTNKECVCNDTKESKKLDSRDNSLMQQEKLRANEQWLALYEEILQREVITWPTSTRIKLQFCYFVCIMRKNYYKSYYWLLKVELMKPPYIEKYLIFRMKRILERCIIASEAKTEEPTQIENVAKFHKVCGIFQKVLRHATKSIVAFWMLLAMPRLNVNELYAKGQRITKALKWVNEIFRVGLELHPQYPYNYFYYGRYLLKVLSNEDEGKEWVDKGRDIMKQQQERYVSYHDDISKMSGAAIIVISGDLDKLGIVLSANEHVESQLGFAVPDLLDRNISRIMPRIAGEHHDEFMRLNLESGHSKLLGNERLFFAQMKSGLVEPICLLVKTLPGLERGARYIGFITNNQAKLKSQFVKFPTYRKGKKNIAYLITDKNKELYGLSRQGCKLFGLNRHYVSKKKGITATPYFIHKLSSELARTENEHKLETGIEVIIHPKSILEHLDFDYIKKEELEEVIRAGKAARRAYVMAFKYAYKGEVWMYAYAIMDLGQAKERHKDGGQKDHGADKNEEDNESEFEDEDESGSELTEGRMPYEESGSQVSSSVKTSLSQSSVGSMKKQSTIRDRPPAVKKMMLLISLYTALVIINIAAEFSVFVVFLNHVNMLYNVVLYAFKRVNNFNMSVYKLLSVMNVANGLEPPRIKFTANITADLRGDADTYLARLKEDEYAFEEALLASDVKDLSSSAIYLPTRLHMIQENFAKYNESLRLNCALLELVGRGGDIVSQNASTTLSQFYVNNFVSTRSTDSLTHFERSVYCVLANSLSEIHQILSATGYQVHAKSSSVRETQRNTLIIVHSIAYAVTILFGVLFLPIICRIQRSKHNLLMLFADIPLREINQLIASCNRFLKEDINHSANSAEAVAARENNPAASPTANNGKEEKKAAADDSEDDKQDSSDKKDDADDVASRLQGKPTHDYSRSHADDDSFKREQRRAEKEDEEEEKKLLAQAQKEKDVQFANERKLAVSKVPIGIGKMVFVVVGIFAVLLTYLTKTMIYIIDSSEEINQNFNAALIISNRFAYLTNTLLFYRSFLKSLSHWHILSNGQDAFEHYLKEALKTEQEIQYLTVYTPSGLTSLAERLRLLDSSALCSSLNVTKVGVDYQLCSEVSHGLLKEGLANSVSFYLTLIRNNHLSIMSSKSPEDAKRAEMRNGEFLQLVWIFVGVYNPLFEWLAVSSSEGFSDLIQYQKALMVVDFLAILFLAGLALFIFINYFVSSLEDEIFTCMLLFSAISFSPSVLQ